MMSRIYMSLRFLSFQGGSITQHSLGTGSLRGATLKHPSLLSGMQSENGRDFVPLLHIP
jgi:hypothetical protein